MTKLGFVNDEARFRQWAGGRFDETGLELPLATLAGPRVLPSYDTHTRLMFTCRVCVRVGPWPGYRMSLCRLRLVHALLSGAAKGEGD